MSLKLFKPKHYYNEFKELSKFVISPDYVTNHALTIPQKIEVTYTMFVVKLILAVMVGVSIGIFYDAENKTTVSMSERFTPAMLFFVSVFVLPLLEEVAYRLSLKFKPIFLALTLGVVAYYILSKAVYHTKLSDFYDHFLVRSTIASAVIIATYPLFSIPRIKRNLELFWENNFKWIFYFFCVVFAWVHILNYELTIEHLLLTPIITLDKLVSAMCYGYVRINYGFIYSFVIHMCNNSLGFMVNLFSGTG